MPPSWMVSVTEIVTVRSGSALRVTVTVTWFSVTSDVVASSPSATAYAACSKLTETPGCVVR